MAQRRIPDFFTAQGTIRTVGANGTSEQGSREVSAYFEHRERGGGGSRGEGRGRGRGMGRGDARGRGRGDFGGRGFGRGRGGEGGGGGWRGGRGWGGGGREERPNGGNNTHSQYRGSQRGHPYRSPPTLNRESSSTLSQTFDGASREATREVRAQIFSAVYAETPTVIAACPGTSSSSTFFPTLLPPLSCPGPHAQTTISVIDGDTYTVAQDLLLADPSRGGKVTVLNMASDLHPGGGCIKGALAQEESLCYRSTLYHTLDKSPSYYPLPPLAGIYSPTVVVHRQDMSQHFQPYASNHEWFTLSVVSIAGLRRPELNREETEFATPALQRLLENKIRQTLRIAVQGAQEYLVLGALGCGAFRNPPELVAKTFLEVLKEQEWKGWFGEVVFAVMAGNGRQHLSRSDGDGGGVGGGGGGDAELSPGKKNYEVFKEALNGVVIG